MMDTADSEHASSASSTMEAMLKQEARSYGCRDYLYQNDPPSSPCSKALSSIEDDRAAMVQWCYQVSDFCRLNRETVAVAMSYFDRFLASGSAADVLTETNSFQLAAMTSLYTAAKINERESFEPWMLSRMSRGLYNTQQLEQMETRIIHALGWHLNPPTAMAFVREFLDLIPDCYLDETSRLTVHDLCKLQAELAVRIYQFAPVKASAIAFAAIKNSMESVGADASALSFVESLLLRAFHSGDEAANLADVQCRLYQAVTEYSEIHALFGKDKGGTVKHTTSGHSSYASSPCTVQTPHAYTM